MTAHALPGKPSIGPPEPSPEINGPIDPSAVYRRLQGTGRDHRPAWMVAAPVVVIAIAAGALIYATTSKAPAPVAPPLMSTANFQNGPAPSVAPPSGHPAKVAGSAP